MGERITNKKIRVLVVDDSAFMGMQVAGILNEDEGVEVVGRARNGVEAVQMVEDLSPDVVTMDVEMPVMDGLTSLKHIMVKRPVPTVMISSFTREGSETTFDALRFGAVDIIAKPSALENESLEAQRADVVYRVKRAADMRVEKFRYTRIQAPLCDSGTTRSSGGDSSFRIIGIVAGSCGYYSLLQVVPNLPADFAGVIFALLQVPEAHAARFVGYLSRHSAMTVRGFGGVEALDQGTCYVGSCSAPPVLTRDEHGLIRPHLQRETTRAGMDWAVFSMFKSLAEVGGTRAVGVVTSDSGFGVEGISEITKAGGMGVVHDVTEGPDASILRDLVHRGPARRSRSGVQSLDLLVTSPTTDSRSACADSDDDQDFPVGRPARDSFSGFVEGVDIIEYLQFLMLSGSPAIMEVHSKDGSRGMIFVRNGTVVHAQCGNLYGEPALYSCLSFKGGSFSNRVWREPAQVSITKPGELVLVEAARLRDEARHQGMRMVL